METHFPTLLGSDYNESHRSRDALEAEVARLRQDKITLTAERNAAIERVNGYKLIAQTQRGIIDQLRKDLHEAEAA